MYEKNLSEDLRLRLSKNDMDFLRDLSAQRSVSVSECIRSIIGEYRRSLESLNMLSEMMAMVKAKEAEAVHGDTKTDLND